MNEHGPGPLLEDEERPLTGVRALVVEDDVDTLELWTEVLTDAGAMAMGATSAEAAFRAFQLRPPDVLIADVALLGRGVPVQHLMPGGRLAPHRPSEGAVLEDGAVRWP